MSSSHCSQFKRLTNRLQSKSELFDARDRNSERFPSPASRCDAPAISALSLSSQVHRNDVLSLSIEFEHYIFALMRFYVSRSSYIRGRCLFTEERLPTRKVRDFPSCWLSLHQSQPRCVHLTERSSHSRRIFVHPSQGATILVKLNHNHMSNRVYIF